MTPAVIFPDRIALYHTKSYYGTMTMILDVVQSARLYHTKSY